MPYNCKLKRVNGKISAQYPPILNFMIRVRFRIRVMVRVKDMVRAGIVLWLWCFNSVSINTSGNLSVFKSIIKGNISFLQISCSYIPLQT